VEGGKMVDQTGVEGGGKGGGRGNEVGIPINVGEKP